MLKDTSNPKRERPIFFGETSDNPTVLGRVSLAVRDLWLAGRLFVQVFILLGAGCIAFEVSRLLTSDGRSPFGFSDPVVMAAWLSVALAAGAWILAAALAADSYWGAPLPTQLAWLAAAYAVALQLVGHLTFSQLFAWTLLAAFIGTLAEIVNAWRVLRDPDDMRSYNRRMLSKLIGVAAAFVLGMHVVVVVATEFTSAQRHQPVEARQHAIDIAEGKAP